MQSYLFSQKRCFLPCYFKKIKSLCNLHTRWVTAELPHCSVVFATCFANKPKGPHLNAFQNWKNKFVTPLYCFFSLFFCPLLSLSVSPVTIMSFSKWGMVSFISSLQKFLENFSCSFSLSHFFFLYNTISCYLRAVVQNRYFNFHSWHISSSTKSVCAAEHHRLPCD